MDRSEFDALLAQTGMTVEEFNEGGQSADELYEEMLNEVTLTWSEKRACIMRYARSVAIAIVTSNGLWLREVGRVYEATGKFLPGLKETSFSGTLRKGETHLEAAIREAREEPGLLLGPDDFNFLGGEIPHCHQSTAYHKKAVRSCNIVKTGVVEIPAPPPGWKRNPVFRDVDKLIYCQWHTAEFPYVPNLRKMMPWLQPTHGTTHGIGLALADTYALPRETPAQFEELLAALQESEK